MLKLRGGIQSRAEGRHSELQQGLLHLSPYRIVDAAPRSSPPSPCSSFSGVSALALLAILQSPKMLLSAPFTAQHGHPYSSHSLPPLPSPLCAQSASQSTSLPVSMFVCRYLSACLTRCHGAAARIRRRRGGDLRAIVCRQLRGVRHGQDTSPQARRRRDSCKWKWGCERH